MSARILSGATVFDVGINRTEGGVVGGVDLGAVGEIAGAITPVPGGVGHDHRQSVGEHCGGRRAAPGPPFLTEGCATLR